MRQSEVTYCSIQLTFSVKKIIQISDLPLRQSDGQTVSLYSCSLLALYWHVIEHIYIVRYSLISN